MPIVAAEQLIRSLPHQRYLNVLPRPLRHEIHRENGRSSYGFFQTLHDLWQRSLKFGSVEFHRHVASAQKHGRFPCIRELVISKHLPVSYRVCRPGPALLIHQSEEQARVKAAAQEDSYRHITKKMTFNRASIQIE